VRTIPFDRRDLLAGGIAAGAGRQQHQDGGGVTLSSTARNGTIRSLARLGRARRVPALGGFGAEMVDAARTDNNRPPRYQGQGDDGMIRGPVLAPAKLY
jgi:hypothetical protein